MTLFAQTLQIAFRVALVWAGGIVLAVVVRSLLPGAAGFNIPMDGGRTMLLVPYNRICFWTCLYAAVAESAIVVTRAMLVDIGLRSPR